MASTITFNPVLTTNGAGSFNVNSAGYIQGIALDDPAIRNALKGGYVSSTETYAMWGGIGISTVIPGLAGQPQKALGQRVTRATSCGVATTGTQAAGILTGFSVFNQDHSMIQTPQSPVPLAASQMGINYYLLGSGARIAVACDPALVNLEGTLQRSLVTWDFTNQQLIAYSVTALGQGVTGGGILPVTIIELQIGNSMTVSFDTATGYATWNRSGSVAIIQI